ncbi:MAG: hypothetical protein HC769_00440 [Cyanobacteria bacterium CRU_2_1]|nr:hypothetical protein [Cyanobacteria bacterium RU_5_0]NJR57440.1 hypothetical protein [Cyanobacteria bacterium CRU_2_1]
MKRLLNLVIFSCVLFYGSVVVAAEEWIEVVVNGVGDRFLIDQNSIERQDNIIQYWEYRYFEQPNNAFLDFEIEQPVHGVMLYQSVDCDSGVVRLRRLVVFDRDRQVIRRENYDDNGELSQPMQGSSAETVLRYVCNQPQSRPS